MGLSLSILAAVAVPPPLSDDEREALSRVVDDRPFEDSTALEVLIRHALTWEASAAEKNDEADDGDRSNHAHRTDPTALPAAPVSRIRAEPARFRGDAFRITGQLLRRDARPVGRDGLEAWIILPEARDGRSPSTGDSTMTEQTGAETEAASTETIAVLVPRDSIPRRIADARLPIGVRVPARFFARFRVASAEPNGDAMLIPIFVGNHPRVWSGSGITAGPTPGGSVPSALIALVILGAGFAFIVLRLWLRHQSSRRKQAAVARPYHDAEESAELEDDLPEEPAEALRVLRDRSTDERALHHDDPQPEPEPDVKSR